MSKTYVVQRIKDGKYWASDSYTKDLQKAVVMQTGRRDWISTSAYWRVLDVTVTIKLVKKGEK